jgi:dihydrofolate reductase
VITGRRVYDDTDGWASENGFFRMPVFVVTHRPQEPVTRGDTTFTFVPGVAEAIGTAKAAAGAKHVHIMGGGSVIRQALRAGLVDRLRLHVVPLILGSGTALFDGDPGPALEWEGTVDTPEATHVTYRCATA